MTDIVERLRGQERAPCDATDEEALDCREGACNCDWKTRQEAANEIERLREALRAIDKATISHVDGRDLLDELHPRHTLDIKRRVDGIETWYEGDWLSRLKDARDEARAALGEGKE